jgi:uncharacterized Zn finger protein
MAQSSCPKCGHHQFEQELHTVQGSDETLTLVQCAQCGTVVGAGFDLQRHLQWMDLVGRVKNIEKMLEGNQKSF